MNDTLSILLGSRLRARLLAWFFTHTEERYFVRQLAGILEEDPANLSRELGRLARLTILSVLSEGNLKFYRVKKEGPLYSELKGLILKTAGVEGACRKAFGKLAGIRFAFVYGSFATGGESADSDIDVMLIGGIEFSEAVEALHRGQEELGREVNPIVYDVEEIKRRLSEGDAFILDVWKAPKLYLIGGEDELRSLARK